METGTMTDGKGNEYSTIKLNDGNWWTKQNWRYEVCGYYNCGCTGYHTAGADPSPSTLPTLGLYYEYEKLLPSIPDGWRLPTQAKWNKLIELYGEGNEIQALHALAKGGSSGLDLEIGGWCVPGGNNCDFYGKNGQYWSSTDGEGDDLKIVLTLDMERNKVYTAGFQKHCCITARLIKIPPVPKPHRGRGPAKRNL